jgi:hypothetical protein
MAKRTKLDVMFFAVLAAGFAARLFVATLGHDFDFDSWKIIAGIPLGDNVYPITPRYNFAPAWFFILHFLYFLSGHDFHVYRYCVAGFLSLADAGIFLVLWLKFGRLAGCWFFLNPISIIVSGYQNNFDNLAILAGFGAVYLIGDEFEKPLTRRMLWGLVVLGFSLVLKHVFFAFPFWLAVKQRGIRQKIIVVLVPVAVFLLSFAPYWPGGKQAIIENVFQYRSFTTEFFYHMFLPQFVQFMFSSQAVWLFCLVLFAFIYRRKSTIESMFLYTCVLVATPPANINEYLAIPLCFVATHLNFFTVLYSVFGTLHLLVDYNGLQLTRISGTDFIDMAVDTLFVSLIWVTWRAEITAAAKRLLDWSAREIENQFKPKK